MSVCERYDRQLHDLGVEGQYRLSKSTVLIVGLGGLGSPAAIYLVAMGVGKLIIVDKDKVEMTNLNRQILYTPSDVGKPKAIIAKQRLKELNPDVEIEAYINRVEDPMFEELVRKADLIIDGLDNWKSRLKLNELAVKHRKPLLHAAVESWYGQYMAVIPGKTPCLHCLFSHVGNRGCTRIVGPVAGMMGVFLALNAGKILAKKGDIGEGYLFIMDFKNNSFEKIRVRRNPGCKVCSTIKTDNASSLYSGS